MVLVALVAIAMFAISSVPASASQSVATRPLGPSTVVVLAPPACIGGQKRVDVSRRNCRYCLMPPTGPPDTVTTIGRVEDSYISVISRQEENHPTEFSLSSCCATPGFGQLDRVEMLTSVHDAAPPDFALPARTFKGDY